MNLVIIHYHLNRGGVTQVIANHLRAINANNAVGVERVVVLYGGRHEGWPADEVAKLPLDVSIAVVPELEYDNERNGRAGSRQLAESIKNKLQQLDVGDAMLHVHNHSLGKNLATVGAIQQLAADGYPVLLQIHDFAEDSRPSNYLHLLHGLANGDRGELFESLYPQAGRIHYAALNGRDIQLLRSAGIRDAALHWLPNPVADFGALPDASAAKRVVERQLGITSSARYVLYPVRGIRRKNIGELALWAAQADGEAHFGLTLAPQNPVEAHSFSQWRDFTASLGLRCHWDVGGAGGVGFKDNLSAADTIISTSVAEGFGMVFLEAWLANRPLVGRDLPQITADFVDSGIQLPDLRPSIFVPRDWLDGEAVGSITLRYREMLEDYGIDLDLPVAAKRVRQSVDHHGVDFAKLCRNAQMAVVHHVTGNARARAEVRALNPWMEEAAGADAASRHELIAANAAVVRDEYSLDAISVKLGATYAQLLEADTAPTYAPANGEAILNAFLDIETFTPVRVEP